MNEIFRERVRERDLHNFLVEEINASPEFLSWIEGRLGSRFAAPRALAVRLQKSPPGEADRRQTDVRIGWFDEGTEMRACGAVPFKCTPGSPGTFTIANMWPEFGRSLDLAVKRVITIRPSRSPYEGPRSADPGMCCLLATW